MLKNIFGILSDSEYKNELNQVRKNNSEENVHMLMSNALSVVENLSGSKVMKEANRLGVDSLIPLGKRNVDDEETYLSMEYSYNSKGKEHTVQHHGSRFKPVDVSKFITLNDLEDKPLPQEEKRILWNLESQKLINQTKKQLEEFSKKENTNAYRVIIDNLERAPFAIRDMKESRLKQYFQWVYQELLMKCLKQKSKTSRKLNERKQNIKANRVSVAERRNKILSNKDIYDDDEPIKNTKSYEKGAGIREMKKLVTKGARQSVKKNETETTEQTTTEESETNHQRAWKAMTESDNMDID